MRVRHTYSTKKEEENQPGSAEWEMHLQKGTRNLERRKHFLQADAPQKQKKSAEKFRA